jgi:hypothetical protein
MIEATFSTKPNGDRIRDRIEVFSNRSMYGRSIDVMICTVDYQDRIVAVVKDLTFTGGDFDSIYIEPTISGPPAVEFLQAALNAAWKAGLRPTNWHDERPGEVQRMDNHLQDMRALVFGGPVPLPAFTKKEDPNVG